LGPETGAGLSNADTFASLTDATTYFTNRPESSAVWSAATDPQREGVLRYATTILNNRYNWPGSIKVETQALAWPRDGARDKEGRDLEDSVPSLIVQATIELARFLLSNPANASTSSADAVSSVTLGSLAVSFRDSAPFKAYLSYLNDLLAPLVVGGVNTARAIRG
jgi:hypothetical protein